MTDIPMIFSTPMVLALLNKRKCQTRRFAYRRSGEPSNAQKIKIGDALWVRETWAPCGPEKVIFKAGCTLDSVRWKSPIHMPKSVCRIRLEVTAVLPESLWQITEIGAIAEGILGPGETGTYWAPGDPPELAFPTPREAYRNLWDRLNEGGWDDNPAVIVIGFKNVTDGGVSA